MIQFDLFEQAGAWELPQKGTALPMATIEVEPLAGGWGYGASWHSRGGMSGGGFGTKHGRVAPTRREAIKAAAAWLVSQLSRLPERDKVARWAEALA